MRQINEVIVHCTATRPNWNKEKSASDIVRIIRGWHTKERGWSDIGYHMVIHRDGTVAMGRPVERSGAHTKGRNKSSIGIALVGGFGSEAHDKFEEHYTDEQADALMQLLKDLRGLYPEIEEISGHNAYASKACPGFQIKEFIEEYNKGS